MTDADGDGWAAVVLGDTCYTVDMNDDYGDGWNGGAIEVYEDGVLMDTLTLSSGSSGSEEYCGTEGSTIRFYFTEGGFTYEIGYDISDPNQISWCQYPQGTPLKQALRLLPMSCLYLQPLQTVMITIRW